MEEKFSSWFRHQLDRREWSQRDFARHAKVAPSTVSNWYRGERVPDPPNCEVIAEAFGTDSDWVLILAGHRPNIEMLEPDDPRRDVIALVRSVDWTPDREAAVRGLLEAWIKRGKGDR